MSPKQPFQPVSEASEQATEPPISMMASILVFTALTIYLGIDTVWSGQLAESVAGVLVGGLAQ